MVAFGVAPGMVATGGDAATTAKSDGGDAATTAKTGGDAATTANSGGDDATTAKASAAVAGATACLLTTLFSL